MIVTTTSSIEGKKITEYRGIVFGEVITGINFLRDLSASFSNFFGGRNNSYEDELTTARMQAIAEMENRAMQLGCNAVVGIKVDCETVSQGNMLMVTASGTAVIIE